MSKMDIGVFSPEQIQQLIPLLKCWGVDMKLTGSHMMNGDTVSLNLMADTYGGPLPVKTKSLKPYPADADRAAVWLADYLVANRRAEVHICMESKQPMLPMVRVAIKHPQEGEPGSVHVLSLDRELHDLRLRDVYWDPADLPEWLHDRLVKLMVMPVPPPPLSIEDIGQRVSNDVFWIYIPKEF